MINFERGEEELHDWQALENQDLKLVELDSAVARALGWVDYPTDCQELGRIWHLNSKTAPFGQILRKDMWHPSTDWSQGGPIIEREIDNHERRDGYFYCNRYTRPKTLEHNQAVWATGPTLLIAAMRCFVASKGGKFVYFGK